MSPLRSIRRIAGGAALAAVVVAAPAAARDDFRVGAWTGGANPKTGGSFTHCSMHRTDSEGIALYFAITDNFNFGFALSSDGWALGRNTRYDIVYWIDDGPRRRASAEAVRTDMILVPLDDQAAMFDRFRAGSLLTVEASRRSFRFALDGSRAALGALLACVNRNVPRARDRVGRGNPFAPDGGPVDRPPEPPRSNPFVRP